MYIWHILLGSLLCVLSANAQRLGRSQASANTCYTPLGDVGACVSLKYCPQVVNLFTQLPPGRAKQYSSALQHICGNEITLDNYPVVCCSRVVITPDRNGFPETTSTSTTTTTTSTTAATPTDDDDATVNDRANNKSNETCRGPFNESGVCKPLENCTEYIDRARNNPTDQEFKHYLQSSNALCGGISTKVCCPSSSSSSSSRTPNQDTSTTSSRLSVDTGNVPHRLPTEEEGCGLIRQQTTKVVGGVDSNIGAWPWIALIGYDAWSLAPFKCGGTLITARHVITAAHCLRSDLSFVRLGEFDLSTESETTHVDINVNKAVGHPDFGPDRRNDIAILLLERNVEFTDLICPICLPVSNKLRTKSYVRSNPFVAGWGRTMEGGSASNVLQQLQIPVLENSVCKTSYRTNKRLVSEQQFDDSVWCAGVLSGGQDTCQGDSGGPLMMPEPYKGITRYYLIGVVSYGIGCARIGIPGVYTNMQHFVDWINERIMEM